MRWKKGRRSTNVEDRRGQRVGRGVKMGGGATILLVVAVLLLGGDPSARLPGGIARPHGRRQGDALEFTAAGNQPIHGCNHQRTSPAADDCMDFIHDHRANPTQYGSTALGRDHEVKALRCGNQDLRWSPDHLPALVGRGVLVGIY